MKNTTNLILIHPSIFEWTGLQILPDNSCSIMCYFYYTQDLAAAENVCLGQSSKNLLTLQDTQAKLQYGEILKILHFACNYSLIREGAEWSSRFGNRLKAIASSIQIVKLTSPLMTCCQKDVSTTTVLPGKSYITKQFAALHGKYHMKINIQLPKQHQHTSIPQAAGKINAGIKVTIFLPFNIHHSRVNQVHHKSQLL